METSIRTLRRHRWAVVLTTLALLGCLTLTTGFTTRDGEVHHTTTFVGVKANTGHALHTTVEGQSILTLSDDFQIPDAPAPHWQVVDSKGNVYLLQRLVVKGDVFHRTITVPAYVPDIATVQIWCAWAETLLGEAAFTQPVK